MSDREHIVKIKEKGEDDFEKNLVLITSGTLVLSMSFIEKIAPLDHAKGVWFLIAAWSLLVTSLLLNLISHQLSVKYNNEYVRRIDLGIKIYNINNLIRNNNRCIACINNWTVGLMVSGMISLVVYCSINAYQMSKIPNEKKSELPKQSVRTEGKIKNGRQTTAIVITKPATPNPPTEDKKK